MSCMKIKERSGGDLENQSYEKIESRRHGGMDGRRHADTQFH